MYWELLFDIWIPRVLRVKPQNNFAKTENVYLLLHHAQMGSWGQEKSHSIIFYEMYVQISWKWGEYEDSC